MMQTFMGRAQERIEGVEGAVMKTTLDWKAECKRLQAEIEKLKAAA